MVGTYKKSDWNFKIYSILQEGRESEKESNMKNEHRVLHRLVPMCFLPREGETNYMS